MGDLIPASPDRELIKEIAMDIGKEVAAYIEVMYPAAVQATSGTFLLSVRNSTYNEIMAALAITDPDQIRKHLRDRKAFRRNWKASAKRVREGKAMTEAELEYHLSKSWDDTVDGKVS
jgi:hypothetical protein